MAGQPIHRYNLEEYLELEDTLDFRGEFVNGFVLPTEAATPTHSSLCIAMGALLREAFFPRCGVYDSSLNVYIDSANRVLHPDVTLLCGERNCPKPECVDNPTIVVEVTSPSTKDYDYGTKRGFYFELPSLKHYLLVSQTETLVGHYRRSGEEWIYADRGPGTAIDLNEVEIRVSALYAGILDE